MQRVRPWLILAVLVIITAAGLWLWRDRRVAVDLVRPETGPAVELVYATGFIEPRQPVAVQSRITAPVARVLVNEGERVARGQALVMLVDDEQHALLDQAAAQRRAAEQAEGRIVTLFRQGWVTRAARDQAVANADAARAAQATASARLDQLVIRAEIAGIVTRRDVEPGELATPARVLMQLGEPGLIRVTATVDERDIARVRTGQQALMSSDAWPGRTIAARVAEVTPGGDPLQRAFRVRLIPDEAGDYPLGMTLEVNIVTRREDKALLIPATALADGHVWTVSEGRARKRAVRTGISGTDKVQVLSGLSAGDTLIDNPPADLAEGQRVRGKPRRSAP